MRSGHGRGYYGVGQLTPRKSSSGWWTFAVIAGIGVIAWIAWPRGTKPDPAPGPQIAPPPDGGSHPNEEIDQLARSQGFSSTKMYEDSVVANARSLEKAGAGVVLAPHLQHLGPRLESDD